VNYGVSKAFFLCGIAISSLSLGITISIGVSDFLIQFTGSPEPTARISKVGSHFLCAGTINVKTVVNRSQWAK